jgi:hypothetical protein
MRSGSRVFISALLLTFLCALISSGRLLAQETAGAPASSKAIDQLTGPIALYPDAVLFQVLTASTDVGALQSFASWMGKNANLKGSELQDAAQKAGFAAAYVALAPFPQVIQMMMQKLDWTKQLGQAFTTDSKAIFESIQRLRAAAMASGNLKTTTQQKVETQTTSNGQQVIVIQPANPQIIYVPQYNPQTVYVVAPAPPPGRSVAGAAAIGFTAGVIIGASSDHYYHHYDEAWEHREDYWDDRQENYQENASQRQDAAQERQSQRQDAAQGNQSQRQSVASSGQSQAVANQSQRQTAAATSSRESKQTASQRSGMSSGGLSGYQSGAAARTQSSRGRSSLSSSPGGRSGGRRQ